MDVHLPDSWLLSVAIHIAHIVLPCMVMRTKTSEAVGIW